MKDFQVLETSKYIVWLDNGTEGFSPRACDTWEEVLNEIRNGFSSWIITKPVPITEPFEKVNNLQ